MNVASVNQNIEFLMELPNTIKFKFKLIYLTETWCRDDQRNETLFNLKNYNSINNSIKLENMAEGVAYPSLFTII